MLIQLFYDVISTGVNK